MFEKLSSYITNTPTAQKISLSERELHVLENKLNVCSANISKALFEMVRMNVDVLPSVLKVCRMRVIPDFMAVDSNLIILYNRIIGTPKGTVLISAHLGDILKIAEIFLHKEHGYFKELNNENLSVVKEISTLLAGYYMTALNELINADYALHKPSLSMGSHGLAEKIIENTCIEPGKLNDDVLMYENDFYISSSDIKLKTMLILTNEDVVGMAKNIKTND